MTLLPEERFEVVSWNNLLVAFQRFVHFVNLEIVKRRIHIVEFSGDGVGFVFVGRGGRR
jgi:hypothetical protein